MPDPLVGPGRRAHPARLFRLSLALFLVGLALLALVPPGVADLPVSLLAGALMAGCAVAAVIGVRRWRSATEQGARGRW
ncbi:hypothetical protein ACQPX6_19690 [Actinomycetospora sp. CA-101289]|uniref:hypothetical protein n=1 Tax=Actinomycetospora sp. CA-101289 TaxID=3239893 RepID=UPI003D953C3C